MPNIPKFQPILNPIIRVRTNVRMSEFVRTRISSKIRTTQTRIYKPEPDPIFHSDTSECPNSKFGQKNDDQTRFFSGRSNSGIRVGQLFASAKGSWQYPFARLYHANHRIKLNNLYVPTLSCVLALPSRFLPLVSWAKELLIHTWKAVSYTHLTLPTKRIV